MIKIYTSFVLLVLASSIGVAQGDYQDHLPRFGLGCAHCLRQAAGGGSTAESTNINYNDRSDTIDILHYTIDLEITDAGGQRIAGSCTLLFTPLMPNTASIRLDLLHLTVDSITLDGQLVTNFNYNDTLLHIPFVGAMQPGDTAELVVYYQGQPLPDPSWGGFYFQQGYAYNIGVGFSSNPHNLGRVWYPCFDSFRERATYTFRITTDNNKRAQCNGTLTVETLNAGRLTRTWEMQEPIPTYLSCVAVNNYATVHQTHAGLLGNMPIELSALPSDTTPMKNSFVHLPQAIDAMEHWYGPMRWNKVGFTVVPFAAGAMEHASNVFYPKFAVNGNLLYEGLMAHELAHSWWGNLATCETAEDMWINEGMATYAEYLFAERVYGWNSYMADQKTNFYNVLRNAHLQEGGYRAVSGIPHQYTYGKHVYLKGAAVAHNLRWYMGDSLYRLGMSQLLDDHAFDNLNSEQMRDGLMASTGLDLTDFFDDWVFAGGYPHFELDKVEIQSGPLPESTVRLRIQQKLRGAPHYHNNVPLQVSFYDRQWNRHTARIQVSGEMDSVQLSLPFVPTTVILNEEHRLNQAREDKQAKIYQTGSNNLMTNMQVQAVSDSAWFHFEHHLVAPDPSDLPSQQLSTTHYWSIATVYSDTFRASGRINLEAAFDSELTAVYGSDSLALFYRPAPDEAWRLHPNCNKVQFFTLTYFNINELLPGDYALGNYFESMAGVQPLADMRGLRCFPNPTTDGVWLEWQALQADEWTAELYDALGRRQGQWCWGLLPAGEQLQNVELPAGLTEGNYWLRLHNGKSGKTLPIRIRR